MEHYILMVENDEDDQYITRQYFSERGVNVNFMNSSEEMFAFLQECSRLNKQLPSLILLDYHIPPRNAAEVVAAIRRSASFGHLPVVVLSGTKSAAIVKDCYRCGANSFIQKPALTRDIDRKISNFLSYWFQTAELA